MRALWSQERRTHHLRSAGLQQSRARYRPMPRLRPLCMGRASAWRSKVQTSTSPAAPLAMPPELQVLSHPDCSVLERHASFMRLPCRHLAKCWKPWMLEQSQSRPFGSPAHLE